eukprot:scaffold165747_cov27-Tisochrysis_lutea.AAC.6
MDRCCSSHMARSSRCGPEIPSSHMTHATLGSLAGDLSRLVNPSQPLSNSSSTGARAILRGNRGCCRAVDAGIVSPTTLKKKGGLC